MSQLVVRGLEDSVVRKLKERAGQQGISMEEAHRRILRDALFPPSKGDLNFVEFLLSIPKVGNDDDFSLPAEFGREITL